MNGALGQEARAIAIALFLGTLSLSPIVVVHFSDLSKDRIEQQLSSTENDLSEGLVPDSTFGPGGRTDMFDVFPFFGRGGIITSRWDGVVLVLLILIGSAAYFLSGRRGLGLPREIGFVLIASAMSYALSWIAFLLTDSILLHLPSRYSQIGLFVFGFTFAFVNLPGAAKRAALFSRQSTNARRWIFVAMEVVILGLLLFGQPERMLFGELDLRIALIVLALVLPVVGLATQILKDNQRQQNALDRERSPIGYAALIAVCGVLLILWALTVRAIDGANQLKLADEERELLEFVATLPKDSLIAGTPCALDSVPAFAKRTILFSCEKLSRNPQVIRDALGAYYQDDPKKILAFCQQYGIDYLVIDVRTYSPAFLNADQLFFEPYNRELLFTIRGQNQFALGPVPSVTTMFQNSDFYVIACEDLAH
jgi:hypothetical protein